MLSESGTFSWANALFKASRSLARALTGHRWAILFLVCAPILAKGHLLLGLLRANPLYMFSNLATELAPGILTGYPNIDPNIGFTSHALGHHAAQEVLRGHVPWWNYFEGIGTPLLGEMQSAALFPFNFLLYFEDGQIYMHLLLQIIGGLSTFFLLRRLNCRIPAATVGAALFEFNGTFAWLANAVINPVAFLPMILWGLEIVRHRACARTPGGWEWISIGLALSLYAGFPEVAYLNGLLVVLWTLARATGLPKLAAANFLFRVAIGGCVGLLLAAPVIISFLDFLPNAFVDMHQGNAFSNAHLNADHFIASITPYIFGPIFGSPEPVDVAFWSSVGGYAGTAIIALAACGVFGRTHRVLRIALAAWVAITLAATFGVPGVIRLVTSVPMVGISGFYRYFAPSWELCLAVLCSLAIDDMAQGVRSPARKNYWLGMAVLAAVAALGLGYSFDYISRPSMSVWTLRSLGLAGIISAVLILVGVLRFDGRVRSTILAVILVGEAIFNFVVPTLSFPRTGHIELGGVRFLQSHLGFQRFYSLGPIAPNYGAYFGIASVNHNDLPIPQDWVAFVLGHLDDNAWPVAFNGINRTRAEGPSAAENLIRHTDDFQRVGVRYVIASPGTNPFGDPDSFPPIYSDAAMAVYELPHPQPYFMAQGCQLSAESREMLTAECTQASHLVRLELAMPGWHASVNGVEQPVVKEDLFEGVDLPPGLSTVAFYFLPPFMKAGYAAFALGCLGLLAGLALNGKWREARPARAEGHIGLPN